MWHLPTGAGWVYPYAYPPLGTLALETPSPPPGPSSPAAQRGLQLIHTLQDPLLLLYMGCGRGWLVAEIGCDRGGLRMRWALAMARMGCGPWAVGCGLDSMMLAVACLWGLGFSGGFRVPGNF